MKRSLLVITLHLKNRLIGRSLRRFQRTHRLTHPPARDFSGGVALVMPCYNHAPYLAATCESIRNQTHRPFEVVFVDDCSTDDSYARLQTHSAELSATGIPAKVVQTPQNGGQSAAVNHGVRATDASVIMVLDADDYLMQDALAVALARLRAESELYLLGASNVQFIGDGTPPADQSRLIHERLPDYASRLVTKFLPTQIDAVQNENSINMTHSGSIFFRSAWDAVGGYWSNRLQRIVIYSDRDFQLRVAALLPIGVTPTVPHVFYRVGSSSNLGASGDSADLWSLRSLLRMVIGRE